MRKVYYISVDITTYRAQTEADGYDPFNAPSYVGNDFFYVVGEDGPKEAEQYLREQIKKYYFKAKLSNKESDDPKRLGERIIVTDWITEATADAPLEVTDVTSMAWLYGEDKKDLWVDWAITLEEANA